MVCRSMIWKRYIIGADTVFGHGLHPTVSSFHINGLARRKFSIGVADAAII